MDKIVPLTKEEVRNFATEWYKKLDVHAPMVEILPMLANEGLEMEFPEGSSNGYEGFEVWYQRVIRIFFDEVHTLKEVTLMPTCSVDGTTNINVVVQWEASIWNPPDAKTARIKCDAYQRWVMKRSSQNGKILITQYIVDDLKYHEGSATL
jgi:hypothetical protein